MGQNTTTLADLMAAAALGAIPTDTPVVRESDIAERVKVASTAARDIGRAEGAERATAGILGNAGTVEHGCGIAGCTHGASHDGPRQPDRQVKLSAPCGAVARMTARAVALAGGAILCAHGDTFAIAERRTYNRKSR